jgi:hypothetical protein
MMHGVRDRSAGDPTAAERRPAKPLAVVPKPPSQSAKATTAYDGASFDAGQDCGTRVAACIARACALELIDGSRWWNRRRHRLMAGALVAYAEELESAGESGAWPRGHGAPRG